MMYLTRAKSLLFAGFIVIGMPSAATAGVVGQWNMDNTFGTTMVDSSGYGNDGITYNVVTSGAGYVFNGTSSKAVVKNSASLTPGDSDFWYSAQFQTDRMPGVDEDYDIIRKGAASTDGGGFRLEMEYSKGMGVAYCSISDSNGVTLSVRGKKNLADGLLHTATCYKTSAGVTLVVDNLAPMVKAGTLGSVIDIKDLSIGCKQSTCKKADSDWYYGTIRSATISIGN
jgi:hypothetical protein